MVILFEGIDTCGKSTQIELISQKENILLKSLLFKESTIIENEVYNSKNIITTKEPGGTEFGKQARNILLADSLHSKHAELLLFLADRAEHYSKVIKPNKDKIILSDRGFLSGIGYALANGDFSFDELITLNTFALQGDFPDKIILFITDINTLRERMSQKSLDGIELRGLEYLMSVQKHMKESLEKLNIEHLIIDATKSIEEIHQKILDYLNLEGKK